MRGLERDVEDLSRMSRGCAGPGGARALCWGRLLGSFRPLGSVAASSQGCASVQELVCSQGRATSRETCSNRLSLVWIMNLWNYLFWKNFFNMNIKHMLCFNRKISWTLQTLIYMAS